MKNAKKALTLLVIAALALTTFFVTVFGEAIQPDNGTVALSGEVEVNGEIIESPAPYFYDGGENILMVPLRAIAESLGYKVVWEQEEQMVIVGYGIQVWIGRDSFRVGTGGGEIRISTAPELTDGRTFVPLDFFRYVLGHDARVSDGIVVIEENATTSVWVASNAATMWFSDDADYEYGESLEKIGVGKTPDGGDVFSLIRMPLRGEWLADEVADVRLFLKIAEGTPQSEIYIGTVAYSWTTATGRSLARSIVHEDSFALTEVRLEDGCWVSMDVTDIVVGWLRSEIPNRGFALFPGDDETVGVFLSGMSAPINEAPRLVVSGDIGERSNAYGRFGFTKQPGQGVIEPKLGGNCFSFALRDLDGIYHEHLNLDFDELNRILAESGENGVLERVADLLEAYVHTHMEGLQISNFRRLDAFDSPIDAETEYRIVLRVAAKLMPNIPISDMYGFDFHFMAQLSDGRWAQKTPIIFSEIVPGTGPGIDPAKFPWDAGDIWGIERWQEWYSSDAVYFAVTKDTDDFTRHQS